MELTILVMAVVIVAILQESWGMLCAGVRDVRRMMAQAGAERSRIHAMFRPGKPLCAPVEEEQDPGHPYRAFHEPVPMPCSVEVARKYEQPRTLVKRSSYTAVEALWRQDFERTVEVEPDRIPKSLWELIQAMQQLRHEVDMLRLEIAKLQEPYVRFQEELRNAQKAARGL